MDYGHRNGPCPMRTPSFVCTMCHSTSVKGGTMFDGVPAIRRVDEGAFGSAHRFRKTRLQAALWLPAGCMSAFIFMLLALEGRCQSTPDRGSQDTAAVSGDPSTAVPDAQQQGLDHTGPLPPNTSFTPPAPNLCGSNFDHFYMSEPGVYAYWALCEQGNDPTLYDYAGRFDFNRANGAWSSPKGTIHGGLAGPVADGESALQVTTASSYVASMNLPLNSQQGTLATWVNTGSNNYPMSMIFLGAVNGSSALTVGASTPSSSECFVASMTNTLGASFSTPSACGYTENTWHRVVFTWSQGMLSLYVDGVSFGSSAFHGLLDNKVFVYRLFPEAVDTGKQMTLAKALVANVAWSNAQVAADFHPIPVVPPVGGVEVSIERLGTVHKDVLGFADNNSDLSNWPLMNSLVNGLVKAGMQSVRYANGTGGIAADLEDWRGGDSCTAVPGHKTPAANGVTRNTMSNYFLGIAYWAKLSLGFTVNYGTNPPACNAGGSPISNGSDLVNYANQQMQYGIKYWEIGNELYNGGGSETDFHPHPADGVSYAGYETDFYNQMKSQDPTIKIGIPVADGVYSWLANWTLPAMANAKYDAVVYHNYPVTDPITDGNTLYGDRIASGLGRTHGSLLALQTELLNVGKSPESIWVTEWNGSSALNTNAWSRQSLGAVAPLFATMELAEYMQAGVQYATWLAQGQGNACWPWNYEWGGETAYSWVDNCGGNFLAYTGNILGEYNVGFKADDISPVAHAFQILSHSGFVTEGEHMLRVYSDTGNAPWLAGYAATHGNSYAVILVNRDRDLGHIVPVQLAGQASGGAVTQWTYGLAQYDQAQFGNWSVGPAVSTLGSWNGPFSAALPAWSVNVFVFTTP